jgi:hypothetical protein
MTPGVVAAGVRFLPLAFERRRAENISGRESGRMHVGVRWLRGKVEGVRNVRAGWIALSAVLHRNGCSLMPDLPFARARSPIFNVTDSIREIDARTQRHPDEPPRRGYRFYPPPPSTPRIDGIVTALCYYFKRSR